MTRPQTTRVITCWNDIEPFGIVPLTGEACGLNMRILCDVTRKGKEEIERFLGGHVKITEDSNWNGGSQVNPHVGSILLPRSILADLAAFLLVRLSSEMHTVVKLKDGTVRQFDGPLDDELEQVYGVERYYRRSSQPGTGDRNTHAMSGRTE